MSKVDSMSFIQNPNPLSSRNFTSSQLNLVQKLSAYRRINTVSLVIYGYGISEG